MRKTIHNHKLPELLEFLALRTLQEAHEFFRHLEGGPFKLESLPRGIREEESIIDMNDVTLIVYHDILVVPVLDLQNVAHQRVGC